MGRAVRRSQHLRGAGDRKGGPVWFWELESNQCARDPKSRRDAGNPSQTESPCPVPSRASCPYRGHPGAGPGARCARRDSDPHAPLGAHAPQACASAVPPRAPRASGWSRTSCLPLTGRTLCPGELQRHGRIAAAEGNPVVPGDQSREIDRSADVLPLGADVVHEDGQRRTVVHCPAGRGCCRSSHCHAPLVKIMRCTGFSGAYLHWSAWPS